MNIQGKAITLRAIEREDLPQLRTWSNDPAIQRMLGGWHFPIGEKDQEAWLDSLSFQSTNQRFAIDTPEHGLIGTANLVSIDWQNRNAFHGMLIGQPNLRGKGYALDTVMTIMRFAFDEMGLTRLDGDMIEYNTASLKFYIDKCGWKIEGNKEDWYFRGGRRWKKIIVGITADKYRTHARNIQYWEK